MKRLNVEVVVGLFLVLGFLSLAYMTFTVGGERLGAGNSYQLTAEFSSIAGIKDGAEVQVAGVPVGTVVEVALDPENYSAVLSLEIDDMVALQDDSIASVKSSGLLGGKLISISPGGSDVILEDGDEIIDTTPSISLEDLIGKYIFNSGDADN